MMILKQILPQVIVTFFLIHALVFRIKVRLNGRYKHIGFRYSIKDYLMMTLVTHLLLLLGGFYDSIGFIQVLAFLLTIGKLIQEWYMDGKRKIDNFDILKSIATFIGFVSLLGLGNFYKPLMTLFQ